MNLILIVIVVIVFLLVIFYQYRFYGYNPDYKVQELQDLLTKEECQQMIDLAKSSLMVESSVVDSKGLYSSNKDFRKSFQTWMYSHTHPVLRKLSNASIDLTGFPFSHQEMIQIVKYEPGGKFDAHYDACVYNDKICKQMNRGSTERRTTLLVYLNDEMEGGETEFVVLNKKVKPETGKGILFWSTNEQNQLFHESKHQGNPVTKGEKWIATVWSHGAPFN